MKKYWIKDVWISQCTPESAIEELKDAVRQGLNTFVCVSNVRTVRYALSHEDYKRLMDKALMCTPDGMPLVWMARLWGLRNVQRTIGPELFKSMLMDVNSNIKHFLLGDTAETLNSVCEKYPYSKIVGTYSPPFCSIEKYDLEEMSLLINQSGANLVWISMRAPKQEYLAQKILPYLDHKVCIGVGAGFRYVLGQYKNPNKTIQKLGLTGLLWRKFNWKMVYGYVSFILSICNWGGYICINRLIRLFKIK